MRTVTVIIAWLIGRLLEGIPLLDGTLLDSSNQCRMLWASNTRIASFRDVTEGDGLWGSSIPFHTRT